jgi:p25-alpha
MTLEETKQHKENIPVTSVSMSSPAGCLEEVFMGFTNGAPDMDGKTLAKIAKDCNLYDKKFTVTDVDLIFAKVKDKGTR